MKTQKRRGHTEFLVLLLLVSIVWGIVMGASARLTYGGHPPLWFNVWALALSPPGLLMILMALIWTPFLWYSFVEESASLVQMACWQYPKDRVWFFPRWFTDRLLTGTAALALAYTPAFLLMYLDVLREVTFLQMMVPNIAACLFAVAITLLRARREARLLGVPLIGWLHPEKRC